MRNTFTPEKHPSPLKCMCHGHCIDCREPVVQCKMGIFHHRVAY